MAFIPEGLSKPINGGECKIDDRTHPDSSPRQLNPHRIDHSLVIRLAKNSTARHKSVRARSSHPCNVIGFNTAINLQPNVFTRCINPLARVFNLAQSAINK